MRTAREALVVVSPTPEGAGTRPSRALPGRTRTRSGSAPGSAGPPESGRGAAPHEGAFVTESRTAPVSERTTRCYVLDTSVLLSDPWSLTRFDEHEVVLPLVVIT
jgi:hypothetical protein